jgi:hypothetical protein
MSFSPISVKEAIEKINASNNGWFLPAVQRPYVWGSRYESEKYICRLFDSLLRGYPIGTFLVWNTDKEIPYREFIDNFHDSQTADFAPTDLWKREDKWLVYDGQQRLQTLYSCLKYTLNDRVLTYNLFWDLKNADTTDDNGFSFVDKNSKLANGQISMPFLFSQSEDGKVKYRKTIKETIPEALLENEEEDYENIIDKLWDIFVSRDKKSLAYYPVPKEWSEERVNDVFQRINTGGVPLSGADLLLSKIKSHNSDFEAQLQLCSKVLADVTSGFYYEPSFILQMLNFIVKGTIRLDPERTKDSELNQYTDILSKLKESLISFSAMFLRDSFHINNAAIIPQVRAILPLIMYVYNRLNKGTKYNKIEPDNIALMKRYFILSQLNRWDTQTITDNATRLALNSETNFPYSEILDFVKTKSRFTELNVSGLENYKWFTLKILTPQRTFTNSPENPGRYNPELDHIFPRKLEGRPSDYSVDIVWNMQPITGVLNGSKLKAHPKVFFTKYENNNFTNKETFQTKYDFVPSIDYSTDSVITSPLWDNHEEFIKWRKEQMLNFISSEYGLTLNED